MVVKKFKFNCMTAVALYMVLTYIQMTHMTFMIKGGLEMNENIKCSY